MPETVEALQLIAQGNRRQLRHTGAMSIRSTQGQECHCPGRPAGGPIVLGLVLTLALGLTTGCQNGLRNSTVDPAASRNSTDADNPDGPGTSAKQRALVQEQKLGHQATVRCLRGERAMTDGDELRCEDWSYVSSNYR